MIAFSLPGGEARFTEGPEPPPREVVLGRQVHGTRVVVDGPGEEADGQATARRDVAVAVRVADCLPVAIGPGIGPCCYEVGDDVRAVFGTTGRTLDLKALARERLLAAGVAAVHDAGRCTMCDPGLHSFRRDATAERQLGIAWRA